MEVDIASGLNVQLADAARALQAEPSTQRTLERCVALATELIDGCDYAGISFVRRKAPIETRQQLTLWCCVAMNSSTACKRSVSRRHLGPRNGAQPQPGQGAAVARWAPQVVDELRVASMLSFQLYTSEDTLGALNLYSKRVDAFDEDDFTAGMLLAAQSAVALAESQATEQWQNAALNRTIIGQVEGILMERFALTADRAFAVLRRVSQQNNVKLYQVAGELVATREIPAAAVRGSSQG